MMSDGTPASDTCHLWNTSDECELTAENEGRSHVNITINTCQSGATSGGHFMADLIGGVVLVFLPGVGQHIWGLDKPIQGAGLVFAGYAGSMIIAWTFLLLWADRKPLERRGVAALTCFPVLFGLMGAEVHAIVHWGGWYSDLGRSLPMCWSQNSRE